MKPANAADLPLIDRCIVAALEELERNAQREVTSELITDPAERAFYRRGANAYRKALLAFLQGTRPVSDGRGEWLVSSQSRGGVVHRVDRLNSCTCEAGTAGQACWHAALALGVEIGWEAVAREDDGDQAEAA